MAQKFLTDIEVTRGLVDSSGDLGVAGQVLSSTGSGTNWITNEANSTVVYLDEFTGDNSTVGFTLSVSVTDENITQVYIDGVYQNKDTYSVSGTTLTFSTAPPLNADIEVITFSTATTSDDLSAGSVIIPVKNTHTASIAKGEPVYITGNVGSSARLQIAPADASNSAKMPAAGLLLQSLAVNAEGYVITGGYLRNITTDTIDGTSTSSNDTVYVKSGGGLTMTKPTGSNLIQNIAKVARSSGGSSGSLLVSSILRTNDVPNLTTGKIWVGSANNTIESGTLHLDESNNRLGIGTANPQDELHLASSLPSIRLEDTDNNIYHRIRGNESNLIIVADAGNTGGSSSIRFQVDADEKMRLTQTGRLGIGTPNPLSTLQVTSGESGAASPWTNADELVLESAGNAGLAFQTPNTGAATIAFQDPESVQAGFIQYLHADDALRFATNGNNERMRIDSSGDIGIGVTDGDIFGRFYGRSVGIGGTGIAKLQLNGTSYSGIDLGQNGTRYAEINVSATIAQFQTLADIPITFGTGTSATERMRLTSGGYILTGGRTSVTANWGAGAIEAERAVGAFNSNKTIYLFNNGTNIKLDAYDYGTSSALDITIGGNGGDIILDGNLGIGVTPESWGTNGDTKAIQISTMTSLSEAFDGTQLASNFYFNGTNDKYIQSDFATSYLQIDGTHRWRYAASGTADANIAWSEAMRIDSSGNVGIGDTTPSYKLDVNGDIQVNETIFARSGSDLILQARSSQVVGINSGGSRTMTLDASQRVGIGLTNPSEKLDVNGRVKWVTATGGDIYLFAGSKYYLDGGSNTYIVGESPDGDNIGFVTGGSTAMTIDENQNVGIGTTSPSGKLNVEAPGNHLHLRAGTAAAGKYWNFDVTANNQLFIITDGNNGMNITNTGNVGIGTSSPTAKLNTFESNNLYDPQILVQTDTTSVVSYMGIATNKLKFYRNVSTGVNFEIQTSVVSGSSGGNIVFMPNAGNHTPTERMRLTTAGNLGIGTTSPSAKLDILQGSASPVALEINTENTFCDVLMNSFYSTSSTRLRVGTNDFQIHTNGSERMRITSGGDVGIGTTSPGAKVDAEGVIRATDGFQSGAGSSTTLQDRHAFGVFKFFSSGSYIHLKTDIIWGSNTGGFTQMYCFHILGYEYGASKTVDAMIAFYNYPPQNNVINTGTSGTHTIERYKSSDNKIVLRISTTSGYYMGFTLSQRTTAQNIYSVDITASAQNSTANHY